MNTVKLLTLKQPSDFVLLGNRVPPWAKGGSNRSSSHSESPCLTPVPSLVMDPPGMEKEQLGRSRPCGGSPRASVQVAGWAGSAGRK